MKRQIRYTLIALAAVLGLASCRDYLEPDNYYVSSAEPIFTLVNNTGCDIAWCISQSAGPLRDTVLYSAAGTIASADSTHILCGEVANYWAQDTIQLCIFNYQIMSAEASERMSGTQVEEIYFKLSSPAFMQIIPLAAPDVVKRGRRIVVE